VCGKSVWSPSAQTGVFLDPPYTAEAERADNLYATDSLSVGHAVAAWCAENGGNEKLRIALCGYEGEYDLPGWRCFEWKAKGGYDSQRKTGRSDNHKKERIWFSPHCIDSESLF